jgi:hypothetical protein
MKTRTLEFKTCAYSKVSIVTLESGLSLKFKKKYDLLNDAEYIQLQDLIEMLKEIIYLTLDLYHCKIEMSDIELCNMITAQVNSIDSISITSKIDYLKNNTFLTLFLNTQENNSSTAGLFWQFPIKTEAKLVNEN